MLKQIYSQGYGEVSILKSKRTFVVGGLTGTAVWDPRFVRGEEEKGERGGQRGNFLSMQLCMMHPGQIFVPSLAHFLIFCTPTCPTATAVDHRNVLDIEESM